MNPIAANNQIRALFTEFVIHLECSIIRAGSPSRSSSLFPIVFLRRYEAMITSVISGSEAFSSAVISASLKESNRVSCPSVRLLNNSILGDMLIYAECKKWAPMHPVNVGLVRQLYGTVEADRATAGIMVTNSYFSREARQFQQTIKSRMSLIDYSELMKQIMDCR